MTQPIPAIHNSVPTDLVMICPHFLYAKCQHGDSCQYSHDISPENIHPKDVPCELLRNGKCKLGKKCWYLHYNKKGERKRKKVTRSNSQNQRDSNDIDPSLEDSISTSDKASCKIKDRINFWCKDKRIRQNYIKRYPSTLEGNHQKLKEGATLSSMVKCPHFISGICPSEKCPILHGILCEMCHKYCLDPFDEKQKNKHIVQCQKNFEQIIAIQCNRDMKCSICFEVAEKQFNSERIFGILEKCYHVFCIWCIKKLKQNPSSENSESAFQPSHNVLCPVCREVSGFLVINENLSDHDEIKKQLNNNFKLCLKEEPCRYFRSGRGECLFRSMCLFRHANPDGTAYGTNDKFDDLDSERQLA